MFLTHPYVSGTPKRITKKHTPANIVNIQNSHLQEIPATWTYPPTIGPSAGPANGVITKIAIAVPLVSLSQLKRRTQLGEGYVQYKQVDSHIRKYRTRVCERCSSKTSTEEAKDKESWSVWGDRTSNLQDLGRPEEIKFKIKIRQLQVVKF